METSPQSRYQVVKFHAKSLRNTAVEDNPVKPVKIYLPPGYNKPQNQDQRYPTVYFLHGYGGYIKNMLILPKREVKNTYPLLFRAVLWKFFRNMVTFEKLDSLILSGDLPPFILIQPDGSLPLSHIHGNKGMNGEPAVKGSFYLNSPFTGRYNDYIFRDLVKFVDTHYRTLPTKKNRALMGGSMGGYGALLGGILHPDKFKAIMALSPAISWLDLLNVTMLTPLFRKLYGKKKALQLGQEDMEDILDTADLIFSRDQPLLDHSHKHTPGKYPIIHSQQKSNWNKFDLKYLLNETPQAFQDVELKISCDREDEYRFAEQIQKFQNVLNQQGIDHSVNIYKDRFAERISPHSIGIAKQVLPGIRFCLQHIAP